MFKMRPIAGLGFCCGQDLGTDEPVELGYGYLWTPVGKLGRGCIQKAGEVYTGGSPCFNEEIGQYQNLVELEWAREEAKRLADIEAKVRAKEEEAKKTTVPAPVWLDLTAVLSQPGFGLTPYPPFVRPEGLLPEDVRPRSSPCKSPQPPGCVRWNAQACQCLEWATWAAVSPAPSQAPPAPFPWVKVAIGGAALLGSYALYKLG